MLRGTLLLLALLFAVACGVKSLPRPPRAEPAARAPEAATPRDPEAPCPTCPDAGTVPPRIPE